MTGTKRAYRKIPDDPDDPRPNAIDDPAGYQRWRIRHLAKLDGRPAPKPRRRPARQPKARPEYPCIGRVVYEREDHKFVIRLNAEGERRLYAGERLLDTPVVIREGGS